MFLGKRMWFIILVFVLAFSVNAQQEKLPSYFSDSNSLLSSRSDLLFTNQVSFKDQVGRNQNSGSLIQLKQIGDENLANINNRYSEGVLKVYQIGDKNNYSFLNYSNSLPVNMKVVQTGNSNLLNILGSNNMMTNITISQFGGAKLNIVNY